MGTSAGAERDCGRHVVFFGTQRGEKLRTEGVIMREYACRAPPCIELMRRFTAHRHFMRRLDDHFDSSKCNSPESPNEHVCQAQPLRTHRRTVRQRENMVWRHVEPLLVRKMQPHKRLRLAHFDALDL